MSFKKNYRVIKRESKSIATLASRVKREGGGEKGRGRGGGSWQPNYY
jgi:hypothetical protein